MESRVYAKAEFGDFQTPAELVDNIISFLSENFTWGRALEPTCGAGSFIGGLLKNNQNVEVIGIEVQPEYAKIVEEQYKGSTVTIQNKDIFNIDLSELDWKNSSQLLVIGNPPWVTNAKVGRMNGNNLPKKLNFKNLNGLDAITGSANFDISEWIIIKLINDLLHEKPILALLCKPSVARSIVTFCYEKRIPISDARIIKIDALKWFKVNTGACLFFVKVGSSKTDYEIKTYQSLKSKVPLTTTTFYENQLVSDKASHALLSHMDRESSLNWRQGIKHDATDVVVLEKTALGKYINGCAELVDIESEYIYPLIKSSDLAKGPVKNARKWVIVPQHSLFEDTLLLKTRAPKLWRYLNAHENIFVKRKSSIYRNKPPFTYFGLGEYTFSDYKVAISALYREPKFQIVGKIDSKPVIFDDTCYFLACDSYDSANKLYNALNNRSVLNFIKSITFDDSMRVVTKKILDRINITVL